MRRTLAMTTREFVELLKKHLKAPMVWRDAVRQYSRHLSERAGAPGMDRARRSPKAQAGHASS